MSLTGNLLPTVLAVLAVGLFVILVLEWPRFERRWARGTHRGLTAVLLNLCVLMLAGALLNDKYAFYVSWSDLMGVKSPAIEARGGTTAAKAATTKVAGPGFGQFPITEDFPALPDPGKQLQKYTVIGQRSGFENKVLVHLPKGYDPHRKERYPVILALHGFPGSPGVYAGSSMPLFSQADTAAADNKMAEAIIVAPQIDNPPDLDTECINNPNPNGPQTETWLAHDLPLWVLDHFDAARNRTGWATWGYSYGGWCSALLGVRHPDIFGASVIMSGYFRPDFDPSYEPIRPGTPQFAQYDLVRLALKHPPAISMWILASKQDSLSYPSTNQLVKDARAPLSIDATLLKTGGHRQAVWQPYIPVTLSWLGKTLPGFKPAHSAGHAKAPPTNASGQNPSFAGAELAGSGHEEHYAAHAATHLPVAPPWSRRLSR